MSGASTIRPAYSKWPDYNRALCEVVAELSAEQLAIQPSPDRWPLWATIGHTACQRVSWLCGFAGEPGADTTPVPGRTAQLPRRRGPGERAQQLTHGLESTFRIIQKCLDTWTVEMLLIFRLGRPDVLPVSDLGVRKGFMLTYRKRELPASADLLKFGELWRPFRSVASWYLWRALDLENQNGQGDW